MENIAALADKYEKPSFIIGDPSWFMHQVKGALNQETMAFIASSISYGSRKQFMPKIDFMLNASKGEVYEWVHKGLYNESIPDNPDVCFYRLYTQRTMNHFLHALQDMLREYGSIGEYVRKNATDGFTAISAITEFFSRRNIEGIIPKNTSSACKRICMFLRWMVRDSSPVDLGLWSSFIDKRTLIIPLDTHVLYEAKRIGLINSSTASMSTARQLTAKMLEFFPTDPLKGDFALFGYGVDTSTHI